MLEQVVVVLVEPLLTQLDALHLGLDVDEHLLLVDLLLLDAPDQVRVDQLGASVTTAHALVHNSRVTAKRTELYNHGHK